MPGGGARRLGLGSAAALVVANMIGAGVFTTSGFALADLQRQDWVMAAARLLPARAEVLPARPPPVDVGAFAVTLVWVSFAYSGWNAAVYVAGEVRDPERNLARSLLLATLAVTAAYLALNAVFVYAAPVSALAGRADVGAAAAAALGGPALRNAISLLVGLALFTSVSAMIMARPRVYARMAEDGLFPARLARVRDVPRAAVALQVGLAIAAVWLTGLVELLGYIGFTLALSAAATVCALLALRRRLGAERVPVPGHPFVPLFFVVATVGSSLFLVLRAPAQAAAGGLTAAAGLPVYLAFRRRQRRAR